MKSANNFFLLALFLGALALADSPARAGHVNVMVIDGVISAATADFVEKSIGVSEEDGALALLIELDTPGGVLAPTKDIVQALLNSDVPTIVYVSPQGAWAASAGTFITIAANVAAMAPAMATAKIVAPIFEASTAQISPAGFSRCANFPRVVASSWIT